jgi:hypothetical protein
MRGYMGGVDSPAAGGLDFLFWAGEVHVEAARRNGWDRCSRF